MAAVTFTTTILKMGEKGHQTGWTYIEIPVVIAEQVKPNYKKEFKVKGKLDKYVLKQVSIMPAGGGNYIMPLNADMRKGIGKKQGAMLCVSLAEDKSEFIFNTDFVECLADEPKAKTYFESLTGSHQRYFSKWIDSAKTEQTKVKRITMSVNALARNMGYPEMIRESQGRQLK